MVTARSGGGFFGWRAREIAGAIRDDQYAHATPLGTARNVCPTCGTVQDMTCYRLADGPFGSDRRLHLRCPTCEEGFTVDRADEAKVLAAMVAAPPAAD